MTTYVPNTAAEQQDMLQTLGAESIDDLLTAIPDSVRLRRSLDLPPALSEPALRRHVSAIAARNANLDDYLSFLGAGSYDRVVPSVVAHLAKRSEFLTAYTPYQPEVSQGMLQATFEFQTMVCQITGMDIANASLYDGSTATVEAALLALGSGGRGEIVISRGRRSAISPDPRHLCASTWIHAARGGADRRRDLARGTRGRVHRRYESRDRATAKFPGHD